jgi:hypothetical protein
MVWQLLGTESTPQLILLLVLLSVFFGVGFPLFSMFIYLAAVMLRKLFLDLLQII